MRKWWNAASSAQSMIDHRPLEHEHRTAVEGPGVLSSPSVPMLAAHWRWQFPSRRKHRRRVAGIYVQTFRSRPLPRLRAVDMGEGPRTPRCAPRVAVNGPEGE